MRYKTLDNSARDSILLLLEKGLSPKEVESITGVSKASISRTVQAANFAKAGDREGLKKMLSAQARPFVVWACEKYGIKLDEEGKSKKSPPTECDLEDAIHVSTRLMTDKICEAIHLEGEAICKKLDQIATIIQSCCQGATEKANANADIAYQEMQKQTEKLAWIQSAIKSMKVVK